MSEEPTVVFFGTPEFAAFILEELVRKGVKVVAVVTNPEKEQGRGLKPRPSPVAMKATELGLQTLTPLKTRDPQFIEALRQIGADLFCVVAYKILPKEVFAMPRLGTFNIHTSLLPKYRGAAPMQWALINGEKETGITTFLLDEQIDTGRILLQERLSISEDETLGELHDEMMKLGASVALKTITGLGEGTLHPNTQEHGQATAAPKIKAEDCSIDFSKPAEQVHNHIRGISPFPGAVMTMPDGERLKIYQTHVTNINSTNAAGMLYRSASNKRLFVSTATTLLEIFVLQKEGKKKLSAEEFLRGSRLELPIVEV